MGGAGIGHTLSAPGSSAGLGKGAEQPRAWPRVTQPTRPRAAVHLDERVVDLHVRLHETAAAYHDVFGADRPSRAAQQQQQQRRGTPARTHGPASACLPSATRPVPPLTPHAAGSFLLLAGLTSPGHAPELLCAGAPRPCAHAPKKDRHDTRSGGNDSRLRLWRPGGLCAASGRNSPGKLTLQIQCQG